MDIEIGLWVRALIELFLLIAFIAVVVFAIIKSAKKKKTSKNIAANRNFRERPPVPASYGAGSPGGDSGAVPGKMKTCPNCGKIILSSASFCAYCGTSSPSPSGRILASPEFKMGRRDMGYGSSSALSAPNDADL